MRAQGPHSLGLMISPKAEGQNWRGPITGTCSVPTVLPEEKTDAVTPTLPQLSNLFPHGLHTSPGWSSGLAFGFSDGGTAGLSEMGWLVGVMGWGSGSQSRGHSLPKCF